jgi:diguanylate cyclase (GGDEF)-like protein/PAS domain S-box-containing protein
VSIRTKTLLILLLTVLGIALVAHVVSLTIYRASAQQMEHADISDTAQRARMLLLGETSSMTAKMAGWAIRDDTCAFCAHPDANAARHAFPPAAFSALQADFLAVLAPDGRLLWQQGYDVERQSYREMHSAVSAVLLTATTLNQLPDAQHTVGGVVVWGSHGVLVAARPIVASSGGGPPRGTLIMGRVLTPRTVTALAAHSNLPLTIYVLTGDVPTEVNDLVAGMGPEDIRVRTVNAATVEAYAVVADLRGRAALALRVEQPRGVALKGERDLQVLLALLLGVGLVPAAFGIVAVTRIVFTRMQALSSQALAVGQRGDLGARLSLGGHDEVSGAAGAVNTMLDALEVSERHHREAEALRESESRYRGLVELSPDAVLIFQQEACVFVNATGLQLLEAHVPEDVIGRPLGGFFPVDQEEAAAAVRDLVARGTEVARVESCFVRCDATTVDVEIAASSIDYQGGAALQVVAHDITERRIAAERTQRLAYHDALTGLPNRLLFKDRLVQATSLAGRHGRTVVVGILDLDRFKEVNDVLGHDIGDRLLEAVAARLRETARGSDTIARVGGDEFFLVLQEVTGDRGALRAVERMHQSLAEPFMVEGNVLHVSASIGASIFPADGTTPDELLKHADLAMYRAKAKGRNTCHFFSSEMSAEAEERRMLEAQLRAAIADDALLLHYQPQVGIETGTVTGLEALVRWPHPVRGMVPPGRFVPIAEESALIELLDAWVLRAACRQLAAWRAAGLRVPRVAVNLSGRQFKRADLVTLIADTLDEFGVPPKLLEVEITERVAIEDPERTVETLHALRAQGVSIALDDFGCGYSSLAYLRRFPVDTLKIDRLFLLELAGEARDQAIVAAMVTLAHVLNARALAEAVETSGQLDALRALGCDEVQGFLFSPGVPPDEVPGLLGRRLDTQEYRRGGD